MSEMITNMPAGWSMTPLGRLVKFGNGQDYKDVETSDGGYPVYGSGGEFRRATRYLHDGESVLFGRKGTIDRPLYVSGKFWTVDTMYYTIPRPHVHAKYVYYAATTIPFDLYSTNTALPSMTSGHLKAHRIPLPPLDEQRVIADYLDQETAQIDALVAKQEEFIGLLRERRSALIVSVAGTISAKETRPLRRLAILSTGSTPSGGSGEENFVGEGVVGWVTPEDLRAAIIPTRFPTANALKQMTVVRASSTLVCGIGASVGKLGFTVSPVTTNQQITSASPREGVHGRYLYYAMAAEREQLFANTVTTTLPIINNVRLGSLIIKFCSFAEQNRIANHLDEQASRIDTLIAKSEEHIALAKERRSALITAAVTGQFDVRTARKAG